MTRDRLTPWMIGALMLLLLCGSAGWAMGTGSSNGKSEAESAREEGYRQGYAVAFQRSHVLTAKRGLAAGADRGRRAGAKTGSREGERIGAGNAEIEQAVDSEKSAQSAASSAEAEIAARQPNCGVVPAAPGWCPTSEELAGYRSAVKAAKQAAEDAAKKKEEKGGRPDERQ